MFRGISAISDVHLGFIWLSPWTHFISDVLDLYGISLTFQLCFEVIEALGQDPRTLCALWSGTGEEDHNKKTTGRQYRNTIFLEVLPDRAFHSS